MISQNIEICDVVCKDITHHDQVKTTIGPRFIAKTYCNPLTICGDVETSCGRPCCLSMQNLRDQVKRETSEQITIANTIISARDYSVCQLLPPLYNILRGPEHVSAID